MAAGRISRYNDNRSNTNGNRDYEGSWNGNQAREVGDCREGLVKPGRDKARQKDNNERDAVNGWYQSNLSRSEPGCSSSSNGNGLKRNECIDALDREPGELSSDSVSDGVTESEGHVGEEDVKYFENGDKQSPVMACKRKFSPIVWDRDEEKASRNVKTNISPVSGSLPLPTIQSCKRMSPLLDVDSCVQLSHGRDSKTAGPSLSLGKAVLPGPRVSTGSESPKGNSACRNVKTRISPVRSLPLSTTQSSKCTPPHADLHKGLELSRGRDSNTTGPYVGKVDALPRPYISAGTESPSGVDVESSFTTVEEAEQLAKEFRLDNNQGTVAVDDEYVSTRTVNASRWANDVDSTADEGEIMEYESLTKLKNERHVADSSEKARLSMSMTLDDRYTDDLDKNDNMNIDVDHSFNTRDKDSVEELDSLGTQEPVIPPTRSVNMLQGCRKVDEYERLNKIDEGTYGVVYRAKDRDTGEIVALKKVKMDKEREGFPLTSLREMNILLSFHHPSIVDVKEVVVGSNLNSIFMVMEYMEHDLKGLMESMKQPFSQSEAKCLMLQLLEGVKYLHDNWVLHRDLKTSNLLLNNRGELKICDFGLARQYGSPLKPYTHLVVTLWYRAPELLLGSKQYSTAIDMWSLGCIMAELLSNGPLFNGRTEFDQLGKIFKTLGMPNDGIWPGYSKLPGAKVNFVKQQYKYNLLRNKFPATSFTGSATLSDKGFDLLNKFLTYDPEKRITAEEALNHAWFREVPLPKSKEFMPTFPAQHAQDRRARRVMKKSPDPLEEEPRSIRRATAKRVAARGVGY